MKLAAKKLAMGCAIASASTLLGCGGGVETNTDTSNYQPEKLSSGWELVWQDEFDGDKIDSKKWSHEVNCAGGGNNERQCYTDSAENSFVADGALNIVALPAEEGAEKEYTSARLVTQYKADFKYGRFEARAKLPSGQGSWPAFWMMPTNSVYGDWPLSGEIDIMEAVNLKVEDSEGNVENRTHGTLHYGQAWPNNDSSGKEYQFPDGVNPADAFHTYAVEWQEGEIRWYVDDVLFATQRKSKVRYNSKDQAVGLAHRGWYTEYYDAVSGELTTHWDSAPFDQKFFMILNLAVGGNWPENVNNLGVDASAFANGQTFEIDYVRVYQCSLNPDTGDGCGTFPKNYFLDAENGGALVEGAAPIPSPPSTGVAQNLTIFDGTTNINWPAWDCCGGSTPAIVSDAEKGDVIEFTVGATPTVNGFTSRAEFIDPETGGKASPFDASPMADTGKLSFDMKVTSMPGDASTAWLLKVESAGASTAAELNLSTSNEGTAPTAGQWQTYTFDLKTLADAGLDLSAIDVVMVFPAWGAGEGAVYQITNFKIASDANVSPKLTVFEDAAKETWPLWDCCGGSTPMVVDSTDAEYGMVAEFAIGATPTVMGFVSRTEFLAEGVNPEPFDATGILSNGVFQFDMKVTSMPADSSAPWFFKVESDNAASAADAQLTASVEGHAPIAGEWQTYTFKLSAFADAGLDVSAIDVVMIFPEWGKGEGAIYQVDNVKIYDPNASESFAGHVLFADQALEQWSIWDCCGDSTPAVVNDDTAHGMVAEFEIGATPTVMGILADDDVYLDASNLLANGMVQFEMKVTSMPNDTSAAWLFKIEAADAATAVELNLTESEEGAAPVLDQWQTYTFSLQTLFDAGLDLSAIDVVMVFPAWGAGEGAKYRIDNFVIKTKE
ncbi:family 16 glycosylhydrolase [Catenovulum sp. 2E275]|uniref:glycoside hydrolase family 16 protein n=1 Tax=Catenovulum sp. 2E275 TaxID=2980497 RepID=UPI0021D2113D|nr:glycoside hydrolase family 16 protein [Catenovulum sp. 2E275]MCU4677542.1 family 16 glycosylhydrolase [Catenovulum sp. 2E275]